VGAQMLGATFQTFIHPGDLALGFLGTPAFNNKELTIMKCKEDGETYTRVSVFRK
jgi:hypothetical protein